MTFKAKQHPCDGLTLDPVSIPDIEILVGESIYTKVEMRSYGKIARYAQGTDSCGGTEVFFDQSHSAFDIDSLSWLQVRQLPDIGSLGEEYFEITSIGN